MILSRASSLLLAVLLLGGCESLVPPHGAESQSTSSGDLSSAGSSGDTTSGSTTTQGGTDASSGSGTGSTQSGATSGTGSTSAGSGSGAVSTGAGTTSTTSAASTAASTSAGSTATASTSSTAGATTSSGSSSNTNSTSSSSSSSSSGTTGGSSSSSSSSGTTGTSGSSSGSGTTGPCGSGTSLTLLNAGNLNATGTPTSVVAADFSSDGVSDLAVANGTHVLLFMGRGDGGFASPTTLTLSATAPEVLAVGHFSGPGHVDLAVGDDYLSGGFSKDRIFILNGQGDGGFSNSGALIQYVLYSPDQLMVGDFNNDGYDDLVVNNNLGRVGLFLRLPDGGYSDDVSPTITDDGYAAIGNFNGDGWLDLILEPSGSGSVLDVMYGPLGGSSVPVGQARCGTGCYVDPRAVLGADLNLDGRDDLVIGQNGGINISLSLPDGGFDAPPSVTVSYASAVAVADLDGDGLPDLVTADVIGTTISAFRGNGLGGFTKVGDFTTGTSGSPSPSAIATADFNRDGRIDVAIANKGDGSVTVFLSACQ